VIKESPYLTWVKAQPAADYNLAGSGVLPCTRDELGAPEPDAPLTERNDYGWAPLVERIADRYNVDRTSVVVTAGASMANHLAMAAVLDPGDHVLVEEPAYDPLVIVPGLWGATVDRFTRRSADGYRLDLDVIGARVTSATRLVVLSNLHNPSGTLARDVDIVALAELGERRGFHVLIDEVYREWVHGKGGPDGAQSGATLSPRVIATTSVTKAFGLNALRVGWILAESSLADRMRRMMGLFDNIPAHPSERLAARALERAAQILDARRPLLSTNRERVRQWVAATPGVEWTEPAAGSVALVDLGIGDTSDFVAGLARTQSTLVVPGRFFGAPDRVRVALGTESRVLDRGLERVAAALGGRRVK
jgi:aspartate/methionine/tyrosine aminotransferase